MLYHSGMTDTSPGASDAWAAYLQRAADRVGGVRALAKKAGLHHDTIYNYISAGRLQKKVTIETIIAIARAIGDHPVNAFLAAANLVEEEPQDYEVGIILQSDLSDEEKQRQIRVVEARRERDQANRIHDTQEILRVLGRQAS